MIDFLVIGGGIAGLSAAARLSELGSVQVLEREEATGYHASGRSAAMFEETYGSPSTVALNEASKHWHLEVAGAKDTPRGLMLLGHEGNADAFAADLVSMSMTRITLAEAQGMVPVLDPAHVIQAGYHAEAWDIDTDAVMARFIRMLRAKGGDVATRAEVTAIERTAQGWRVHAGAAYEARHIINAAGAWADQVALLAGVAPLGLRPLRRSMARIPAPGGVDVGAWPMLFGPGETWYSKPDAGALLISPADEDLTDPHDAWAEDLTIAEGIARYEGYVTYRVKRLLATWAGLRTFAPDGSLVIGPDPMMPSFLWSAGQGGYGMQSSPAASQLLVDIVGGAVSDHDAETISHLSPSRF